MKIVRNIFLIVLLFGIGYFLFKVYTDNGHFVPGILSSDSTFIFPKLVGPKDSTVIPPMKKSTWKTYSKGKPYGIAVLLTDTGENSNWMGLVHGFKSFGIPFKLYYKNVDSALKHDVVFVYPTVDASMNPDMLAKLSAFPARGGTLIGQCIEGGLTGTFGFRSMVGSSTNFKIRIADNDNPLLREFTDSREKEISLGNQATYKETIGTYEYGGLTEKPMMTYPTGMAFMTQRTYPGGGHAYAFGMDIGFYVLNCENELSLEAFRTYVNSYEPSMDVMMRVIKNIYTSASPTAVTLGTVPENKSMTLLITHDIDYSVALQYAMEYAKMEKSRNITTTYFVQVKYIRDVNDLDFFNDSAVGIIKFLDSLKMEVASHSISHSRQYNVFPLGTGAERYPAYHPMVKSKTRTTGGTVLGELRVSKFLIDNFIKDNKVVSFRPGHLSLPFSLPQCLLATGYKYSSDVTANDVLTHLPYQLNYNRNYNEELPLFEFPITVEDEAHPGMGLENEYMQRLDSTLMVADRISKYGGLMCILLHPSVIEPKMSYEKKLLDKVQSKSYCCTMREYGDWWAERNKTTYYIEKSGSNYALHIVTPSNISNLTFFVPQGWVCTSGNVQQTENSVLVQHVTNGMVVNFTKK